MTEPEPYADTVRCSFCDRKLAKPRQDQDDFTLCPGCRMFLVALRQRRSTRNDGSGGGRG